MADETVVPLAALLAVAMVEWSVVAMVGQLVVA